MIVYPTTQYTDIKLKKLSQTKQGLKVEYHAYENPLKNYDKNSICWSTANVSNNQKIIPYHTSFFSFLMPLRY